MSDAVFLNDLWVPAIELSRMSQYQLVDGIIDIDVRKIKTVIQDCINRDVALDIGAHVGAISTFLSRNFHQVEAFEAAPEICDLLQRNTAELPNVNCHNVVASSENGVGMLEYVPSYSALSHVTGRPEKFFDGDYSTIIGPLPARALDDYAYRNVSFIKVDVEGTECDVLRGLKNTIMDSKPKIIVAQAKNDTKYHGGTEHEATEFLLSLGMKQVIGLPFGKDRVFTF